MDNLEVDGLVKQREELDSLMLKNPEMEKRVQKLVRKVLQHVRSDVSKAAKNAMKSSPRQAYKAVKTAVYRQILGGNVSILDKKRAGVKFSQYEPPRKLRPRQRGGNRMERSQRTRDLMSYAGPDRAFVLRFLNSGTDMRYAGYGRNGRTESQKVDYLMRTGGLGKRGRIAPRNFFGSAAHTAMRKASEELVQLIDQLIKEETTR